jgi:hypothetical protein
LYDEYIKLFLLHALSYLCAVYLKYSLITGDYVKINSTEIREMLLRSVVLNGGHMAPQAAMSYF